MTAASLTDQMANLDRVVRQRDRLLAESVLHDEYALVVSRPVLAVMPRARWLAVLPDYVVGAWQVRESRIDVTEDVAAVLQHVQMTATVLGEDRSGLFVISDIWLKGSDGWQIWRRHSTPLDAGRLPGVD